MSDPTAPSGPAPGVEPVTEAPAATALVPPAELTCPRCGGGLPASDPQVCPSCGNPLGNQLFGGAPPPLPDHDPDRRSGAPFLPPGVPPPPPAPRPMLVLGGDPDQLRPLSPVAPKAVPTTGTCAECGGGYDADGYCTTCGAGRPEPRHHMEEQPAPWLAGVCDRGIRHRENQDAMALRVDHTQPGRAALVVCDGVSTAMRSDEVSLSAAQAAAGVLSVSRAQGLAVATARHAAIAARLEAAADAAVEAVAEVTAVVTAEHSAQELAEQHLSLPSCTFVAAVVEDHLLVAGSVGDSRAYWIPDGPVPASPASPASPDAAGMDPLEPIVPTGPYLLTEDDSYAQEQIRIGIDRAQAESGPHAHTITRWLGVDAPDHTPATRSVTMDRPGWVLLCSDGLWNYASAADQLADVVHRVEDRSGREPLDLARALVRWGKEQGGHDNITVALARFDPAPATPEPSPGTEPETVPPDAAPGEDAKHG